jgi:hypothetical protein
MLENKSKAFGVRATPKVRAHIKLQAASYGTTVSDMLVIAAFYLGGEVEGSREYWKVKAEVLDSDIGSKLLLR